MKFEKQKLLTILDEAIIKDRKKYDEKIAKEKAAHEKSKADFVAKINSKWADSIKKIAAAIKAGKPVTSNMLPSTKNEGFYYYYFDEKEYKPKPYIIPVDLLTSRKMVELSSDEYVNTSQIKVREVEAAIRASL